MAANELAKECKLLVAYILSDLVAKQDERNKKTLAVLRQKTIQLICQRGPRAAHNVLAVERVICGGCSAADGRATTSKNAARIAAVMRSHDLPSESPTILAQ
jgi:hypothetical protein